MVQASPFSARGPSRRKRRSPPPARQALSENAFSVPGGRRGPALPHGRARRPHSYTANNPSGKVRPLAAGMDPRAAASSIHRRKRLY
jgi:hypothetical protein